MPPKNLLTWFGNSGNLLKLLFTYLLVAHQVNSTRMADADNAALQKDFTQKSGHFANMVYNVVSSSKTNQNIVFSPFSIQTCVAMARVGAEGETAAEMDQGLNLVSSNVERMAESFSQVLAKYENSNVLKIANKIYVMRGFSVQKSFNSILTEKFFSAADEIDFAEQQKSANIINGWVESKTNNLIRDLISADDLSPSTRMVLLNAIHFKGLWKHKFQKQHTKDEDFYINESDSVKVPMMSIKERFRYAELPEFDATALEMPYEDTDLSMLVILPNSRTGMANLEQKLKDLSLNEISQKMHPTQVIVKFPKFKSEFSIELTETFKKLGMSRMFSGQAEFGNIFENREPVSVSKIIHKAFIEVNEEGTEAAAATGMLMMRCAMPMFVDPPKKFEADRPFFYVIKTHDNVNLFMGVKVK